MKKWKNLAYTIGCIAWISVIKAEKQPKTATSTTTAEGDTTHQAQQKVLEASLAILETQAKVIQQMSKRIRPLPAQSRHKWYNWRQWTKWQIVTATLIIIASIGVGVWVWYYFAISQSSTPPNSPSSVYSAAYPNGHTANGTRIVHANSEQNLDFFIEDNSNSSVDLEGLPFSSHSDITSTQTVPLTKKAATKQNRRNTMFADVGFIDNPRFLQASQNMDTLKEENTRIKENNPEHDDDDDSSLDELLKDETGNWEIRNSMLDALDSGSGRGLTNRMRSYLKIETEQKTNDTH